MGSPPGALFLGARMGSLSDFCRGVEAPEPHASSLPAPDVGYNDIIHHFLDSDSITTRGTALNTLLQSVGRVAKRLGKTEPQKVWILFQDHTTCRYIEANSTKKALPQIAAELHETVREFVDETSRNAVKDSGADQQYESGKEELSVCHAFHDRRAFL
jgi:hypothetical protein